MAGLKRVALTTAMYSAARTGARPPQMRLAPRRWPLSWFSGATPASAAASRERVPSSGSSPSSVRATAGPMGIERSNASFSRQTVQRGLVQLVVQRGDLAPATPGLVEARLQPGRQAGAAVPFGAAHLDQLAAAGQQ